MLIIGIACLGFVLYNQFRAGNLTKFVATLTQNSVDSTEKNTPSEKRLPIESVLNKKLIELECKPSDVKSRYSSTDNAILIQATIPRGQPIECVIQKLSMAAEQASYRVTDCSYDEKKQTSILSLASGSKHAPAVSIAIKSSERFFSTTAKIAFIIENMEDTSYECAVSLLSMPEPLSISIVPSPKKAALIAQLAEQHKKEIIVRLPLEPQSKVPAKYEKSTIMVHYPKETIHTILSHAVTYVPSFSGFSNVYGARACEDSRVMNLVLADIKKRHGYFVETKTTKNSVIPGIATTMGISYATIYERIDKKTVAAITSDLKRLGAIAQANGEIIVSAVATKQLAEAFIATRQWFKENGIKFTFVSEIAKHPKE